jgi:hypothetical protein
MKQDELIVSKDPWPPPYLEQWCEQVDTEETPGWLFDKIIPTDSAVLMSGRAFYAYKTWNAMAMAVALASGQDIAHFKPIERGNVLFIEAEGPRKKTRNRWKWVQNGHGVVVPASSITFVHRYNLLLDDPACVGKLVGLIKERDIKLVIADTLAKMMSGDENSVRDLNRAMIGADKLRKANTGCSILLLHHLRKMTDKPTTDINEDVRGSSALPAFTDVHLGYRQVKIDQGWNDLTVLQNDGEPMFYHACWDIKEKNETAELTMTPMDPANIDERMLSNCLEVLLDGEEYRLPALMKLWTLNKVMATAVKKKLKDRGDVISAGHGKIKLP